MQKLIIALSVLAFAPSMAAAQWYGSSFGKTTIETGNKDVSVNTLRHHGPMMVGIQNHSLGYVQCSAKFTHLPVIDETQKATIAPGKSATLVNREGYPTPRIDVAVKCVEV